MQLRKQSSFKTLIASAFKPLPGVAGLIYRLEGKIDLTVPAKPAHIMEKITPQDSAFKQLSFTFAAIALSAQVARLDGGLSREKYLAFRDAFPLSGGMCGKIRKLFISACDNETPFEHYVTQIKYIFPRRLPLFTALVDRLFSIASAGGALSHEAERMLGKTAHMLEVPAADYSKIRDRYLNKPKAHTVLGVDKRVKSTALKRRYRDMMRRYHPDRFGSEELSPEVAMLLRLKTSEINAAYHLLRKKAA